LLKVALNTKNQSINQSRVDGLNPIHRFNPAPFSSACLKPELGFLTSHVVVFIVFTEFS